MLPAVHCGVGQNNGGTSPDFIKEMKFAFMMVWTLGLFAQPSKKKNGYADCLKLDGFVSSEKKA